MDSAVNSAGQDIDVWRLQSEDVLGYPKEVFVIERWVDVLKGRRKTGEGKSFTGVLDVVARSSDLDACSTRQGTRGVGRHGTRGLRQHRRSCRRPKILRLLRWLRWVPS